MLQFNQLRVSAKGKSKPFKFGVNFYFRVFSALGSGVTWSKSSVKFKKKNFFFLYSKQFLEFPTFQGFILATNLITYDLWKPNSYVLCAK